MVVRSHVEVARFRWVVRGLLGDVVCSCVVRKIPIASEDLAENRVQRFFDSRRTDMPTAQVEFHDGYESVCGIVHLRDG